ncbi:hypothetical protein PG990_009067 [Apiospora arundinis]
MACEEHFRLGRPITPGKLQRVKNKEARSQASLEAYQAQENKRTPRIVHLWLPKVSIKNGQPGHQKILGVVDSNDWLVKRFIVSNNEEFYTAPNSPLGSGAASEVVYHTDVEVIVAYVIARGAGTLSQRPIPKLSSHTLQQRPAFLYRVIQIIALDVVVLIIAFPLTRLSKHSWSKRLRVYFLVGMGLICIGITIARAVEIFKMSNQSVRSIWVSVQITVAVFVGNTLSIYGKREQIARCETWDDQDSGKPRHSTFWCPCWAGKPAISRSVDGNWPLLAPIPRDTGEMVAVFFGRLLIGA